LIDDVTLTPLNVIPTPGGDVLHALKKLIFPKLNTIKLKLGNAIQR